MNNSKKLIAFLLSGLLTISINAAQTPKETPESSFVDKLTKIGQIINDIKDIKLGEYFFENKPKEYKYQIANSINNKLLDLSEELLKLYSAFDSLDEKTRKQIIARLNKGPKNLIFKKFIDLLTNEQGSLFVNKEIGDFPINIRGRLNSVRGFTTKQEFVDFVANIIKKLGDEPAASEFIKRNK